MPARSAPPARFAWRTWLPSVRLDWDLGTPLRLRFPAAARRSTNQPVLGPLAYGDPAAPIANVFRWNGSLESSTTLVARAGTVGDPSFSAIRSESEQAGDG